MSTYNSILQAIKSTFEKEFKVGTKAELLKKVTIMSGGFNGLQAVLDKSKEAPFLGIGIRNISKNTRNYGNQLESIVEFSIYLITSEQGKPNLEDGIIEALSLVEQIKLIILNGDWKIERVGKTENNSITCQNYYAEEFYEKRIILWEINWKQNVLLGENKWVIQEAEIDNIKVDTNIKDDTNIETQIFKIEKKVQ